MKFFDHRIAFGIVLALTTSACLASDVTLFEHDNFGGRRIAIRGAAADLSQQGFNDIASSVIVRSGNWQLCEDSFYRGYRITLGPGRYPSLNPFNLNDRVSSLRDVGWQPQPRPPVPPPPPSGGWGPGPGWGGATRVIMYEGTNFTGRSFVINGGIVRNFDGTGFNDRASSMRVEQGLWIFCSDADFNGECRTFGPGDYAFLPPELNNAISSGRQISSNNPYNNPPQWAPR